MKTLPITLGIGRSAAGASSFSKGTESPLKKNPALKEKIFTRDDYTCRCCGFRAEKYQDILFINGNVSDVRPENMVTTCIFCHQSFNLDAVGAMRSGVLVWLPEIQQNKLHHMARAIYVARISQGPVAEAARSCLDTIMSRREDVKTRLGTDDPSILAQVLKDYVGPKVYEARKQKLEGIRLFPLDRRIIKEADLEFNQFPQILAFWRSKKGPFAGRIPKDWVGMFSEVKSPSKNAA